MNRYIKKTPYGSGNSICLFWGRTPSFSATNRQLSTARKRPAPRLKKEVAAMGSKIAELLQGPCDDARVDVNA